MRNNRIHLNHLNARYEKFKQIVKFILTYLGIPNNNNNNNPWSFRDFTDLRHVVLLLITLTLQPIALMCRSHMTMTMSKNVGLYYNTIYKKPFRLTPTFRIH